MLVDLRGGCGDKGGRVWVRWFERGDTSGRSAGATSTYCHLALAAAPILAPYPVLTPYYVPDA